jgi:molybdate transport system ATP-binding protein
MSPVNSLVVKATLTRTDFSLDVDLQWPTQGITAIFGPSGSGKTSLLRCLAGLERPEGRIAFGPTVWQDTARGQFQPTWKRRVGVVFQEASLFDHLDVRQNLEYGWRRRAAPSGSNPVETLTRRLGISHLLHRSVEHLSGGERQRVAIARALAAQPDVLLLDEPLASLDQARRKELLPWLEELQHTLQIPVVLVTHSVDELTRMADHLVWLDRGRAMGCGPLDELLRTPALARTLEDEACVLLKGRVRVLARDVHLSLRDEAMTTPLTSALTSSPAVPALPVEDRWPGSIAWIEADPFADQALVGISCGPEMLLSRIGQPHLNRLGLAQGQAVWCEIRHATMTGKGRRRFLQSTP